jgi:hypothetical protein
MLFGTLYDVYVHKPLEKSFKIQRQRLNGGDEKVVVLEPQSKFVTFIRLFSVVGIII